MRSPLRGQIFSLRKADASGKHRPILVVSANFLNSGMYFTGVPFTSQQLEKRKQQQTCVYFVAGEFGLDRDCVAKTDDVSQFKLSDINTSAIIDQVDDERMAQVSAALRFSLGI